LSAFSLVKDQIKKIFVDFEEGPEYPGYDELIDEDEPDEIGDVAPVAKTKPSVVSGDFKSRRNYEVMVVSPKSFDESLGIAKNLTERKTVVLNLELVDHEQSQRIVDFLAGATYALTGHQQKIGENVFIFTPNNVNITAEQEKKTAASITDAIWNQVK